MTDRDSEIERLFFEFKRLPWSKGLSEDAIRDLAKAGELVQFNEGDTVYRPEDQIGSVLFVIRGRLQATVLDMFGKHVLERPLVRGSVFGIFFVVHPDRANTEVVATEPSTGVQLEFDRLMGLLAKYPELHLNLYQLAANLVRQFVLVDRTKAQPLMVGIVHHSRASRRLTPLLVRRLIQMGESPSVAGDDPEWQPIEGVSYRVLFEDGQLLSEQQRQELLNAWSDRGRIFVDLDARLEIGHLIRLMRSADTILWCLRPGDVEAALKTLRSIERDVAGWRDKICLVWVLDDQTWVAPFQPDLSNLVARDFKISFAEPAANQGRLLKNGVERVVHYLRGIQIGLALGGGAARGMAHLGVLKVLEENGIHVDMIAGTSAGAMTGMLYAFGMDADHAVQRYVTDLRLPWYYRRLPSGAYFYLLRKYRTGKFDPMLRAYLNKTRLEQLPIPMLTVTADLVRGGPVVREKGDAVRSVIESINLPWLSLPIVSEGEALVDGGLLNNIPADVLVSKGCNYVLASSVTAKIEAEFMGIRAEYPDLGPKRASLLKTLMRSYLVQSYNMNSVGVQPADYVIAPDVTAFDLTEFERADELANVGEYTTRESIERIKEQLAKIDRGLFG